MSTPDFSYATLGPVHRAAHMIIPHWQDLQHSIAGGLHQIMHTCALAERSCAACREADLITITDKQDLQQAMGEVMEAAERSASLPGHGTRGLPLQTLLTATPLKFQLVKCAEV